MRTNPLLELKELGQSIWLDSIRREHIAGGGLWKLVNEDGITGETANPSLFEKAIAESTDYDNAIHQLADAGKNALEIYEALAVEDVQMAVDIFRPIFDRTNGADGFVSIEVSPKLAHDTRGSIAEAKRFVAEIDRPNVMIKIPGTKEGVPAIEECLYQGININITLLFAVEMYEQVVWAYIRALERRAAEGKPIDHIASVASFFVSRIDTLTDNLLAAKKQSTTDPGVAAQIDSLVGKVAIANAKMAYQKFNTIFGDPRFRILQTKGARVQRPLWASTSTKNPRYRDVMYVEALVGPDTVNTLPLETIGAFRDHGIARSTIGQDQEGAQQTLENLGKVDLNLDSITEQLLDEGVTKFDQSLDQLLQSIEVKRDTRIAVAMKHAPARLGKHRADERRVSSKKQTTHSRMTSGQHTMHAGRTGERKG